VLDVNGAVRVECFGSTVLEIGTDAYRLALDTKQLTR
jgi:hypothetical protein